MGNTDSHVPLHARPIEAHQPEIVIKLKDPQDIYRICSYLQNAHIPIIATNTCKESKDCFIWLEKTEGWEIKMSEDACGDFPLVPCQNPPSKGTYALTLPQEITAYDLKKTREEYEKKGFHVSAESPPTNIGKQTLYFNSSTS